MYFLNSNRKFSPKDTCKQNSHFTNIIAECNDEYSQWTQDKSSYDSSWHVYDSSFIANSTYQNVYNAFQYTQASQIDSYPFAAVVHTYFGGGYVFKMIGNTKTLSDSIATLRQQNWINTRTAAIFVEFTLYNPNLNLYQYCVIVFETLNNGKFVNSAQFVPLRLVNSELISLTILTSLIYVTFVFVFTFVEFRSLMIKKLSYFKMAYNYIDLVVIAFSWASLPMFVYKMYASYSIHSQLSKHKVQTSFVNLQNCAMYSQLLDSFLAICAAFVTLRFIKLLRFNKRIIVFLKAFKQSLGEMVSFGIVFAALWLGFVQAIYLLLNDQAYEFATFQESIYTCFQIILGKFNSDTFSKSKTVLAPILFVAYNVVIIFVMLNILVSTLIEHFESARGNSELDKEDPELMEYLVSLIKPLMFWRNKKKKQLKPSDYLGIIENLSSQFDMILIRFQQVIFKIF